MKVKIRTKTIFVNSENYSRVAEQVSEEINDCKITKVRKKNFSSVPICFDTETTKAIGKDGNYHSAIYIYQLQVGNLTLIFRVRDLLVKMFKEINYICADLNCSCYCAIANIKYEWSFLRKSFIDLSEDYNPGILLDNFDPLSPSLGKIILVDICKMTNASLAKIGKDYCGTHKLKGDLDYDKPRNSKTPLTQKEIAYCVNDVVVGAEFMAHIHQEYTEQGKPIPLTATGIPRSIMKEEAYRRIPHSKKLFYQNTLDEIKRGFLNLTYKDYSGYMKYLFRGGYTHGNRYYIGQLLEDIEHVDYTSDYPACMLQHKYPTVLNNKTFIYKKKPWQVKMFENEIGLNKLLRYENDLAFYCTVEFTGLKNTTDHSIESTHKCTPDKNNPDMVFISPDARVDNGRILTASKMKVIITEQDYAVYKKFYKWESITVTNLHVGEKKPLPKYVIMAVVNSYVDKKYNKDHHIPYASEKAILNSCYGCTVQRLNIEDMWECIVGNKIETYKCPFPHKYLEDPVVSDTPNNKSFDRIVSKFIEKYKAIYGKELSYNQVSDKVEIMYENYLKGIYRYDEKKQPIAYLMSETICDVLQQRAYVEQVQGSYGRSIMLSCFWGIWITAYARRRLLDMVFDLETYAHTNNYEPIVVYCDTDSMFLNCHQDEACWRETKSIIDKYNKETREYNKTYLAEYGKLVENKKVENPTELLSDIGEFAWETKATHFKHLGAKRYLQRFRNKPKKFHHRIKSINRSTHSMIDTLKEHNSEVSSKYQRTLWIAPRYTIESTIAGLSKKDFSAKVDKIKGSIEDKFNFFKSGMMFEDFETSKLIPTYENEPYEIEVTDEYGNTEIMREDSGQVLNPVPFEMVVTCLVEHTLAPRVG